MTAERDPRWWYDDSPLEGPECPCCHRTDGSHNVSCPIPRYNREWSKIRTKRADDNGSRLFGSKP